MHFMSSKKTQVEKKWQSLEILWPVDENLTLILHLEVTVKH